jgi:branched-chain amino acid transport system permease protein
LEGFVSEIIQLLLVSIESGLVFGMVAVALTIIYKTARVLNFAQGTLAGASGFITHWFFANAGLPWLLAAVAALPTTIVLSLVIERVAVRRLLRRGFFPIVVATLAIDKIVVNGIEIIFGADALVFPAPLTGIAFTFSGVQINKWSLVIAGTSVVLFGLVSFVIRSNLGLSMRAFADDQDAARLMGISDATVSRTTWALSITVGGVIGIVLAPVLFLQTGYMANTFVLALAAAVLGGFSSIGGALLGGLLIGGVDVFAIRYAPPAVQASLPLITVLLILVLKPGGLFTRTKSAERV